MNEGMQVHYFCQDERFAPLPLPNYKWTSRIYRQNHRAFLHIKPQNLPRPHPHSKTQSNDPASGCAHNQIKVVRDAAREVFLQMGKHGSRENTFNPSAIYSFSDIKLQNNPLGVRWVIVPSWHYRYSCPILPLFFLKAISWRNML